MRYLLPIVFALACSSAPTPEKKPESAPTSKQVEPGPKCRELHFAFKDFCVDYPNLCTEKQKKEVEEAVRAGSTFEHEDACDTQIRWMKTQREMQKMTEEIDEALGR